MCGAPSLAPGSPSGPLHTHTHTHMHKVQRHPSHTHTPLHTHTGSRVHPHRHTHTPGSPSGPLHTYTQSRDTPTPTGCRDHTHTHAHTHTVETPPDGGQRPQAEAPQPPEWADSQVSRVTCSVVSNSLQPRSSSPPGSSVHGAGFSYNLCQESLGPGHNGGDGCWLITEPLRLQFPADERQVQAGPQTSRASATAPAGWALPATGTRARATTSALPGLTAGLPVDGLPSQTEPAAATGQACSEAAMTSLPQGTGLPLRIRGQWRGLGRVTVLSQGLCGQGATVQPGELPGAPSYPGDVGTTARKAYLLSHPGTCQACASFRIPRPLGS